MSARVQYAVELTAEEAEAVAALKLTAADPMASGEEVGLAREIATVALLNAVERQAAEGVGRAG